MPRHFNGTIISVNFESAGFYTMAALLNRLRGFHEFHDMIDALTAMGRADHKIAEALAQIFNEDIVAFAKSQPTTISKPLLEIQESGKKHADAARELDTALQGLPADLQRLKDLHDEISKRTSAARSADEQAAKSTAAAEKARSTLDVAESRGSQDVYKARVNEQVAREKMERDKETAERVRGESSAACEDLRKKFTETLTSALAAAAEKRAQACKRMAEIAQEMVTPAGEFGDYEDKVIPKLQKKLSDLDFEVVD